MENIDIFDLFDALSNYITEPNNKEYEAKVNEYKSKMIVRNFLPLAQKEAVMLKTLYDIESIDTESQHFMTALEISLTFNGLMAYVVNINYEDSNLLKDDIFYDLFWISGIGDYILSFCEKDYQRVRTMVTSMISFENFKELLTEISKVTPDSINSFVAAFNSFKLEPHKDTIKNLADIVRHNDPMLTGIKENIQNGAWEKIQKAQEKKKN